MFDDGVRRSLIPALLALALSLVAVGGVLAILAIGSVETAGAWQDLLEDRTYLDRLGFSLLQAGAATLIGLALGLPASWCLSRGGLPLRGLLATFVVAPLAVPGVVVGLGLDLAAGGELVPRVLVVLAHAVFATAAVTWLVTPAWNAGDRQASEGARVLGAGRARAYLAGSGRHLPGAVRIAAALAFWYAFAAAGTVAILGGTDGVTTESALAFGDPAATVRPTLEASLTAERSAVALIQIAIGLAVFTLGGIRWPRPQLASPPASSAALVLGSFYVLALGAALWTPLAVVVAEATAEGALSGVLGANVAGEDVGRLLAWTAILAALSALAATAVAWLGSSLLSDTGASGDTAGGGRKLGRWALALPAAMTGAALGWAGLVLGDRAGIDLERTYALVVAAHALIAYPFALRILGARRPTRRRLIEDTLLLGASPRVARWRWDGRPTAMALGGAFLVAAVLSAGEVAAANLLTPREATPAALGVLQGWASGEAGEVYALGAALAAVAVIAFGAAEWLRRAAARVEAG